MSTTDGRCYDPSALLDWSRPLERIRAEAHCLGALLMPGPSKTRTIVTLLFVTAWMVLLLGVEVTPQGQIIMQPDPGDVLLIGTTAVVFAVIGQMWHLERIDAINEYLLSRGQSNDQQDVTERYGDPEERRKQTEDYPDD